jgi:hypothetical protein
VVAGGAGGAVTISGNLPSITGQRGGISQAEASSVSIYFSGDGGNCPYGYGGRGVGAGSGIGGQNFGSGGSGGTSGPSAGAASSGAGAPGLVIIWEYS